jgi:hypothetical protein
VVLATDKFGIELPVDSVSGVPSDLMLRCFRGGPSWLCLWFQWEALLALRGKVEEVTASPMLALPPHPWTSGWSAGSPELRALLVTPCTACSYLFKPASASGSDPGTQPLQQARAEVRPGACRSPALVLSQHWAQGVSHTVSQGSP